MKIRNTLFALGIGALVFGLSGCGGTAASAPSPTVTVTESPAPNVTAPQSCLDALDLADQGFGIAEQMFTAISNQDMAGMDASTQQLQSITAPYQAAKAACRAAAQSN